MFQIVLVLLDAYHWVFLFNITGFCCFNVLQHNNKIQHSRVSIVHTGCEHWTRGQFEGKVDCWDQFRFTIGTRPVLKWLSFLWYSILLKTILKFRNNRFYKNFYSKNCRILNVFDTLFGYFWRKNKYWKYIWKYKMW